MHCNTLYEACVSEARACIPAPMHTDRDAECQWVYSGHVMQAAIYMPHVRMCVRRERVTKQEGDAGIYSSNFATARIIIYIECFNVFLPHDAWMPP